MPCNANTSIFTLCTDYSKYGPGATSVDVYCTMGPNGNILVAPNFLYTFYLQRHNGSTRMNQRLASGAYHVLMSY